MSEQNPYAPPQAAVIDVIDKEIAPALWNPAAAANWSLLFSPIFGAFLQMENWKALGQPEKAAKSRLWLLGSIAFFITLGISSLLMPESKDLDTLRRGGGLVLLLVWYYATGKSQHTYVITHFGKHYPHRSWAIPLLTALSIFVVYAGLFFIMTALLIAAG